MIRVQQVVLLQQKDTQTIPKSLQAKKVNERVMRHLEDG